MASTVGNQSNYNHKVVISNPTVDKIFVVCIFVVYLAFLAGPLSPFKWNLAWHSSEVMGAYAQSIRNTRVGFFLTLAVRRPHICGHGYLFAAVRCPHTCGRWRDRRMDDFYSRISHNKKIMVMYLVLCIVLWSQKKQTVSNFTYGTRSFQWNSMVFTDPLVWLQMAESDEVKVDLLHIIIATPATIFKFRVSKGRFPYSNQNPGPINWYDMYCHFPRSLFTTPKHSKRETKFQKYPCIWKWWPKSA